MDERRQIRFDQLLEEPVRNGIYKPKPFHGAGSKIVNMGELFAYPRLRSVCMKRVQLLQAEIDRFGLARGDLLFARRSLVASGAGKCSIVLEVDEPTVFESSIIRARPDVDRASPAFLYYYFNSPAGRYQLGTILRQVAVAGITGKDLSQLRIPIPPLMEQHAIAFILGALDDKIELNRKMNETLEAIARAVFKSWFVDFGPVRAKAEGRDTGLPAEIAELFPDSFEESELGEIPSKWRAGILGDIIAQISERLNGEEAEVLSAVASGRLVRSEEHFNKRVHSQDISRYLRVLPGDFAYNPSRINIGSIGTHEGVALGAVSPVYVVFRTQPDYRWFMWFCLRKSSTSRWIQTLASGSVRQSLSYRDFASIPCVIPPNAAIAAFNSIWTVFRQSIICRSEECETLDSVRDLLLPKLISGELRIPDAERIVEEVI